MTRRRRSRRAPSSCSPTASRASRRSSRRSPAQRRGARHERRRARARIAGLRDRAAARAAARHRGADRSAAARQPRADARALRRALRRPRRRGRELDRRSTLAGIDAVAGTLADDAMVVVPGNADSDRVRRGHAAMRTPHATRPRSSPGSARTIRPHRTRCMSICSGALLAARAGLLDGHDCTTHFSVLRRARPARAARARARQPALCRGRQALQQRRRHGRHRSDAAPRRAA